MDYLVCKCFVILPVFLDLYISKKNGSPLLFFVSKTPAFPTSKRRQRVVQAFKDKDTISKQQIILSWYCDDGDVNRALGDQRLSEVALEQILENIPSCSLDDAVDINCVKNSLIMKVGTVSYMSEKKERS